MHIAKPHKSTIEPNLDKECVCPIAKRKLLTTKRTKMNPEPITVKLWQ